METVVDLSFTVQCYVSMVYAVTFLCVYHATDLHQKSRIELFFCKEGYPRPWHYDIVM